MCVYPVTSLQDRRSVWPSLVPSVRYGGDMVNTKWTTASCVDLAEALRQEAVSRYRAPADFFSGRCWLRGAHHRCHCARQDKHSLVNDITTAHLHRMQHRQTSTACVLRQSRIDVSRAFHAGRHRGQYQSDRPGCATGDVGATTEQHTSRHTATALWLQRFHGRGRGLRSVVDSCQPLLWRSTTGIVTCGDTDLA